MSSGNENEYSDENEYFDDNYLSDEEGEFLPEDDTTGYEDFEEYYYAPKYTQAERSNIKKSL